MSLEHSMYRAAVVLRIDSQFESMSCQNWLNLVIFCYPLDQWAFFSWWILVSHRVEMLHEEPVIKLAP